MSPDLTGLSRNSVDFNQAFKTDTHHAVGRTRGPANGGLSGDIYASFEKSRRQIRVVRDADLLSIELNENLGCSGIQRSKQRASGHCWLPYSQGS